MPLTVAFVAADELCLCRCQLYAKLEAYAGQRLSNDTLKQRAWAQLNTAGLGQGSTITKVPVPNALFATNEVRASFQRR